MNIRLSVAGVAAATALTALLTACSSSGGGPSVNLADLAGPPSTSSASTPNVSVAQPTGTSVIGPDTSAGGGKTVSAPGNTGFPAQHGSTSTVPHTSAPVSAPSAAVTYRSISFPRPYNCAQAGTTYYTAPNVTAAMDVTVLVTSSALAHDLVITAPNRAPRGLSNASQWISSKAVGDGVWQATYRTYVALYQPKFTPVTVSALQASADGSHYTISFPSPVSVGIEDCHS